MKKDDVKKSTFDAPSQPLHMEKNEAKQTKKEKKEKKKKQDKSTSH